METQPTTTIKYSSYTPAQKRATQKYREKNKDKVNQQRKEYYLRRKESDPAFLEYKRNKAKEYYQRKKLAKVAQTDDLESANDVVTDNVIDNKSDVPDSIPIVTSESVPLTEDLTASEDDKPKKKRVYKPREKKLKIEAINAKDDSDRDSITLGSADTLSSEEASTASDRAFIVNDLIEDVPKLDKRKRKTTKKTKKTNDI